MKNKKGFSLVEILGVIVILGIIAGISIASYSQVKKLILEEEYDNLIILIETKAASYANDYYVTAVNVQTLIETGYLEAEEGYIYSPIDNEILNCYVVETSAVEGEYSGKFSENSGSDAEGICNTYDFDYDFGVSVVGYEDKNTILSATNVSGKLWYNQSVCLVASIPNDYVEYESTMLYTWSNNLGMDELTADYKCIDVTNDNYYAVYYLEINYKKDVTDENYLVKRTSKTINIDTKSPELSVKISDENSFSMTKEVSINAYDIGGSGIDSITLTKVCDYSEIDCENEVVDITDNSYTVTNNGNYKVIAVDNVGNETSYEFEINLIDNTNPIIYDLNELSADNYYQNLNLEFSAQDLESGILSYALITSGLSCLNTSYEKYDFEDKNAVINMTYTASKNSTYTLCVMDEAGNIGEYALSVNSIDVLAPTVNISNITTQLVSNDFEVKLTFEDEESKVAGYFITSDVNAELNFIDITPTSSYSVIKTYNEIGTYYVYAIDVVGNVSDVSTFTISSDDLDNNVPIIDYNNSSITLSCEDGSLSVNLTTIDDNEVTSEIYINQSKTIEPNTWKTFTSTFNFENYGFINGESNYIWIKLTDSAGNTETYNMTIEEGYATGVFCETSATYSSAISNYATYETDYGKTYYSIFSLTETNQIIRYVYGVSLDGYYIGYSTLSGVTQDLAFVEAYGYRTFYGVTTDGAVYSYYCGLDSLSCSESLVSSYGSNVKSMATYATYEPDYGKTYYSIFALNEDNSIIRYVYGVSLDGYYIGYSTLSGVTQDLVSVEAYGYRTFYGVTTEGAVYSYYCGLDSLSCSESLVSSYGSNVKSMSTYAAYEPDYDKTYYSIFALNEDNSIIRYVYGVSLDGYYIGYSTLSGVTQDLVSVEAYGYRTFYGVTTEGAVYSYYCGLDSLSCSETLVSSYGNLKK